MSALPESLRSKEPFSRGEPGTFASRHIGPSADETAAMLRLLGATSLEDLLTQTVPESIRFRSALQLPAALSEHGALEKIAGLAAKNRVFQSFLGMGYHGTLTPTVIQRNILENPGWYTAYTPYQAEIAQGRMEALLNFQTMICDLTGLEIANASLLDESTAAAEAMAMCKEFATGGNTFFVAEDTHPQTISLLQTRAKPLGIEIVIGSPDQIPSNDVFGGLAQYPGTAGRVRDLSSFVETLHAQGALAVVAADPLALTLLKSPGEFDADIAVGSAQRFGVPLGYGGPHPGFLATKDKFKRRMPGRIIGVSRDSAGKPALRLTLQTREQHIRRDKATSNICTAQVLLAVIASMYAVYHGPDGLRTIARRIHQRAQGLASTLRDNGFDVDENPFFDTVCVRVPAGETVARAAAAGLNLRALDPATITITLDETTVDLSGLLSVFGITGSEGTTSSSLPGEIPAALRRTSPYLTHPSFHRYHTETELLRYIRRLESKDLSLTTSMIPLGSCTMKLNATSEMLPVTWKEFGAIHPFAPAEQTEGYRELFSSLEAWLNEITGFAATSLQPNAGSQGEYAGLLAIRAYHESRGDTHRNVCLIPTSAHGTNPASAVMAGFEVVGVKCDDDGNIDVSDLKSKAEAHSATLAAVMVTYPSTHGVFEESIRAICACVHEHGGQVYMDGANMNAQVGICRPGDIGADVCHLNLHKTFCIPHGGGGPGVGPICVAAHLAPFLPGHPEIDPDSPVGPVSAAPWGSASILPISWMFIIMMGPDGLASATAHAILNANYIAERLEPYFPVLYRGTGGRVAHECILDLRGLKARAGIEVEDVAKRLMDFGFHAPTMSWPVPGTLMVEPTESESKAELDRFCEAMILIHGEILKVETGEWDRKDNPLKNAPHTASVVTGDSWDHPYPRSVAAYAAPWLAEHKYWPPVGRVDNVYGDRNLFCTCPSIEA